MLTAPNRHRRWADAESPDDGETARPAPHRDGRCVSPTNGRCGNGEPELRGTLRFAGGSTLDLAGKPGHGTPAEEIQAGCRALRRGHRFPAPAWVGPAVDANLNHLAMGGATSFGPVYGADRDRQILA